jgi:ferredoxin
MTYPPTGPAPTPARPAPGPPGTPTPAANPGPSAPPSAPGTPAQPRTPDPDGPVRADRDRCCGSGLCVLRLPDVFDQDDTGIVLVLDPNPPPELRAELAAAVDACPSRALSLDNP